MRRAVQHIILTIVRTDILYHANFLTLAGHTVYDVQYVRRYTTITLLATYESWRLQLRYKVLRI